MKTKKTATAKKTAPKKAVKKTATKKVAVKKEAPKKSATGNKELDLMLAKIKTATKEKKKSVVVFTTTRDHHKANVAQGTVSVNDLKPKLLEAYKHLFCKFELSTNPVNLEQMQVEWIVKIK